MKWFSFTDVYFLWKFYGSKLFKIAYVGLKEFSGVTKIAFGIWISKLMRESLKFLVVNALGMYPYASLLS